MRIEMLPSTIDENGMASARQHLLTLIVDDHVAIDAGCLALSCSQKQREQVRDIVLTHPHLDHIAGLPLFVDDLFATLEGPIRIHATEEIIGILERDLFNWAIYPRFSELSNDHGPVVVYKSFERGASFEVLHLSVQSVAVNHKVSANGYILADGKVSVAITGDTAPTDEIWEVCNSRSDLKAVLVECAFPNEMGDLAAASDHMTPSRLSDQIARLKDPDVQVFVICIKPMYRERVVDQLAMIPRVKLFEMGKAYDF